MNFYIPDLYDFLRGPGLIISITVFLSGTICRILLLIRGTRRIQTFTTGIENMVPYRGTTLQGNIFSKTILILKMKLRNTIFGTNPIMAAISLVFHILLFVTPVFLAAHNVIADLSTGISLPSIPEGITDVFTILLIAAGGFFLARRIFIKRVRKLTTPRDYFMLILVMAPFISAFCAYHHFFNYRSVIFAHMIIGETAIMIAPFTGLIHMPFIIFSRFCIDSEYSIIPGSRSW